MEEVTKVSSPQPCQVSCVRTRACVCATEGSPEGVRAVTQHPLRHSGEKQPRPLILTQAEPQEACLKHGGGGHRPAHKEDVNRGGQNIGC